MDAGEYELEYFGFTTQQVSLERRHTITKFLDNALQNMIKKLTDCEETSQLLIKEKSNVLSDMLQSFEKCIKEAEGLDNKYFSIPKEVLLAADAEVAKYDEQYEKGLDDKLEKLKREYFENCAILAALELENSQYEKLSSVITEEINVQDQVNHICNSSDLDQIESALNNIKALK